MFLSLIIHLLECAQIDVWKVQIDHLAQTCVQQFVQLRGELWERELVVAAAGACISPRPESGAALENEPDRNLISSFHICFLLFTVYPENQTY